jgi:SAM-dependent methyltransferase
VTVCISVHPRLRWLNRRCSQRSEAIMLLEVDWPEIRTVEAEVGAKIRTRHPSWPGWPVGHWYGREYTWVLTQCGDVTGLRCMEAGGAGSPLSAILADRGAAESIVADLRTPKPYPARSSIRSLTCDLQDTGLEPGSLDLIVSPSSLEHNPWEAEVRIIRHLLELLRPGGRLLMTVPCVPTADERYVEDFERRGPVYLWTHTAARRMRDALKALATMESPLLSAPRYDREWRRIHAERCSASPQLPAWPFESLAMAWRRR